MTKRINCPTRVFIAPSLTSPHMHTFAVCSITVASPGRHLFHFHRLAAPSFGFYGSPRNAFALSFFRIFLRRSNRTRLRFCFSRVPAIFLLLCFWRTLANIVVVDTVAANRSQLQVTNVSGPIDVGLLLFCDRSFPPPSVVKFDEKQRLHNDRERNERTLLFHNTRNLRNRYLFIIYYISIIQYQNIKVCCNFLS